MMARVLTSPRRQGLPAAGAGPARPRRYGRAARTLARGASSLVLGAVGDIGEMLILSLMTAGAAAAAMYVLVSLVLWVGRTVCAVVLPGGAQESAGCGCRADRR